VGRIRLEAASLTFSGSTSPLAHTSAVPQPAFPDTGQPLLAIASVNGLAAPASPAGSMLGVPDILLPAGTPGPVTVVLTAANIPPGTTVQLTAAPQSGPKNTGTCALFESAGGLTCTATVTISTTQTTVLTATATFPLVAGGGGPLYADGEEIRWVRVASAGAVTYLTGRGREVPAPPGRP